MFYKELLFSFILTFNITLANNLQFINPDYDSAVDNNEKPNIRTAFLNKKLETERQKYQLKLLEQLDKNKLPNIIYEDDIAHYKVSDHLKTLNTLKRIEHEFKDLITMKGVKYFYKRDHFWRTWRPVKYPDGTTRVVNYKYQDMCEITHTGASICNENGIWAIEDTTPPCPYEIFSLQRKDLYCAVEQSKFNEKLSRSCPMKLDMTALTGRCGNPIVTEWKVERDYSKVSKFNSIKLLNDGRHNFELLTLYTVTPQQILFRIVNASNIVMYSRIMRSGRANYVCTQNCGKIKRDNYKLVATENPLSFNLFDKGNAPKKRENPKHKTTIPSTQMQERSDPTNEYQETSTKDQTLSNKITNKTDEDWLQVDANAKLLKQTTSVYDFVIRKYFKQQKVRVAKKYKPANSRVAHCKKVLQKKLKESKEYSDSKDQSNSES